MSFSSSVCALRAVSFFCFLCLTLLLAFTQSAQAQDAEKDRFEIQAERMFALFDDDKDGFLSQTEMEKLKGNEVRAPRFDLNRDQKLSMEELVAAISRRSSAKVGEIPKAQAPESSTKPNKDLGKVDEALEMYKKFFAAAMKKNDKNSDGIIDAKELKAGQWSSPWRKSDLDGDGTLSKKEMQKRYEQMFKLKPGALDGDLPKIAKSAIAGDLLSGDANKAGGLLGKTSGDGNIEMLAGSISGVEGFAGITANRIKQDKDDKAKPQKPTFFYLKYRKSSEVVDFLNSYFDIKTGSQRTQARQMQALMQQMAGGARRGVGQLMRTSEPAMILEGDVRFGADPAFNSIYVVGATKNDIGKVTEIIELLDRPRSPSVNSAGKDAAITVELFLIRAPQNATPEIVENSAKNIASTGSRNINRTIAGIAKSLGAKDYDRLQFTTTIGSSTTTTSSTRVPRVIKQDPDARVRQSRTGTNTSYGLIAEVTPRTGEDCYKIDVALEKNDAVEGDEGAQPTLLTWNFQSTVRVDEGQPSVVTSTSAKQAWILVVCVK